MACRNCVMCFAFAAVTGVVDGYYKRIQEEGAPKWFGLYGKEVDATISAALEGGYATQTRVDCSLYEGQVAAKPIFSEPTLVCGKVRAAAAPAAIPAGTTTEKLYRVVEQNAVTGVTVATKFYKQSDNSEVTVGDAAGNYWVDDGCC